MDYTQQSIGFKMKKVFRYLKLYGLRRTLSKIRGQLHMKKRYKELPEIRSESPRGRHVGIIGCGNFAYSNIAYYLRKNFGDVIRGSADLDLHRAASLYQHYALDYYSDNPNQIIKDPDIDLVFIASNHASHAEYAIDALKAGKSVHIEKPHVVSEDQLMRLSRAAELSDGKINLGFNRPRSQIGQKIKRALDTQSGPSMLNWFVMGHEIVADHWYHNKKEGGRVIGNLCHWTDIVYEFIPNGNRYPITITPVHNDKSICNIAVCFGFGEGSIASIIFTEPKGHAFEGVKERFSAVKGSILISMDDFKRLVIEDGDSRIIYSPLFRDHGHEKCICRSYGMVRKSNKFYGKPCSLEYIWETGDLFLKTRQALEEQKTFMLTPFDHSILHDDITTSLSIGR